MKPLHLKTIVLLVHIALCTYAMLSALDIEPAAGAMAAPSLSGG